MWETHCWMQDQSEYKISRKKKWDKQLHNNLNITIKRKHIFIENNNKSIYFISLNQESKKYEYMPFNSMANNVSNFKLQ